MTNVVTNANGSAIVTMVEQDIVIGHWVWIPVAVVLAVVVIVWWWSHSRKNEPGSN